VDDRGPLPRDGFALTFRAGTLKTGVWPTIVVCLNCVVYFAMTWDRAHRPLLTALVASAVISTIVIARLPMERILRGAWCEPFFLSWSAGVIGIVAAATALDGGSGSPLVVLFFLPLVYAALSYPLGSMLAVGALDLAAFGAVAATTAGRSDEQAFLFAAAIVNAAWICAWQSRNHDDHRRQLDRASRTDPLTGCLNRRGFEERFGAELSRARREGTEVALVLVDLDHFKAVNDQQGHAAGDRLLCWVADRLRDDLRAEDMVARLGGDEFALLLVGTEASVGVERVAGALAERAPASVGVAVFPGDGVDQEDLHRVADVDLYARKNGRRQPPAEARRELSWAAALAAAVDERMAVQHEHSHAVAQYAAGVAGELGWAPEAVDRLRLAAMLHDVGKVRVPEAILRKPAPLTESEWLEIAKHPVVGAEIVARVEGLAEIGPWIRHSHERLDGGGYPDGLRGEDIPPASRILLVADAFDAMTSDRSYRLAMAPDAAMAELERNAGTQFDPSCVAALRAHLARGPLAGAPAAV
jgi:diguanylate cyclase (GGDEF)-like protein/putative nucleotidyltransferase with HDIG domain